MLTFNIDYSKLTTALLPTRLRTTKLRSWLATLIAPVKYIYNLFVGNRSVNLYYLLHDSQVAYMQAVLNDTFDNTLRRIKIVDSTYIDPIYTYVLAELKQPMYLYLSGENSPMYAYLESEISPQMNGFIIQLPSALYSSPGQRWQKLVAGHGQ